MHYVKHFHINGVETKQVACIELHGKPNAATEGMVGVLGIDMDSPLHDVYKCVAVNGSIYTWELLSSGLSIMSANTSGAGAESMQFPYANLLKPAMYVVKIGDLILDSEGYLYQIEALDATYCAAKYSGTQVVAYGKSAYKLAVENGFEGNEKEWLASLKGVSIDRIYYSHRNDRKVTYGVLLSDGSSAGTFSVTDGADGNRGDDGQSPTVAVAEITGGHRVAITDVNGTHTFDVMDGAGAAGDASVDNYHLRGHFEVPPSSEDTVAIPLDVSLENAVIRVFAPEAREGLSEEYSLVKYIDYYPNYIVVTLSGAHEDTLFFEYIIDITKSGDVVVDYTPIGLSGGSGVSPTVKVTEGEGVHHVSITDVNGTKTFDVLDGKDGKDGDSIIITNVSQSSADGGTNVVSFSDGSTLLIKNGHNGKDGEDGVDGKTPSFKIENGNLYVRFSDTEEWVSLGTVKGEDGTNGTNDANGKDGNDGVGIASIEAIGTRQSTEDEGVWYTTLEITLTNGEEILVDVRGGDKGATGADGKDGVSPTVSVSKSGKVTTIAITDKDGTKTATINDGTDGGNGKDGANGQDGTSVTVSSVTESTEDGGSNVVTFSDGKTLTVKNGRKGNDGYTPVKGVDYFDGQDGKDGTDGLDATPVTPLFANSIAECTDESKLYVLPDGFIYAYMYGEDTGPSYTNLAGAVQYDKRLSSSGAISGTALTGAATTDFIPVKQGDVVRVKGLNISDNLSSSAYPYFCFYTAASESSVTATGEKYLVPSQNAGSFPDYTDTASGGVGQWTAFTKGNSVLSQHDNAANITHIRISGKYFADQEIIITVNEEITEGTGSGYAWRSTGHAFVPADYEAEINRKANKTDIPTALKNPYALTINGTEYDGSKAVDVNIVGSGNILYGKKWVACGDSFTANGYNASDGFDESVYIYQDGRFAGKRIVYPYIIGLRNNMDIVNKAVGGQTMAASSNSFMSVYQNIDADADYITIMLGINDKVMGLPVGTLEDTTSDTFCGAYNIAMEHILENHPFAHIGIMVSNGTNAEIMEATRGIAERWGVPYLDFGSPQVPLMHRWTGRNVCAKAQEIREKNFCVISDGITPTNSHPNTAAHEYESTFIEAWLRTL